MAYLLQVPGEIAADPRRFLKLVYLAMVHEAPSSPREFARMRDMVSSGPPGEYLPQAVVGHAHMPPPADPAQTLMTDYAAAAWPHSAGTLRHPPPGGAPAAGAHLSAPAAPRLPANPNARRRRRLPFIPPRREPAVDTIECAYPEAPLREGESNAWRVRGSDNAAYIVKFHLEGDRTALNELVCACLARHFGLPSLKPFLVLLETWHAEQINRQRATRNLPPIGAGPHFGVKYARSFITAESFARTMGRAVSAGDIGNLDRVPDILGFDTLVQNNDRHCNNVGVVPSAAGRRYSYRVFDFDLAFFGHNWSAQEAAGRYRRLRPIMHFCLVTSAIRGRGDFARFIDALGASLEGGFDAALDALPPEWGPDVRADVEGLRAAMADLDSGSLLTAIVQGKNLQVTR